MPTTLPANPLGVPGALLLLAIGAALVLGLALLLWGRQLHRGFLVIVAAGVGLAVGDALGRVVGLHPVLARLVGAVTLGALALVLARLVWAALAGASLAAFVAGVVMTVYLQAPLTIAEPAGGDAVAAVQEAVRQAFETFWNSHAPLLVAATAAAGVAGLIVAFLLPRVTVIVMTSLLGAGLVFGGAGVAAGLWLPTLLLAPSVPPYVWSVVSLGLWGAGLLFQSVGEIRACRAKAEKARKAAAEKTAKKDE